MNNKSLELINRLPRGLEEIYTRVDALTEAIGCHYLVVGATARDMVLVHGYGARLERGTRDVDFGIDVPSWDAFSRLRELMLENGFKADGKALQKFHYESSDRLPWEIDIVPFGAIEDPVSIISWPPDHDKTMSVLGFEEAARNAIPTLIGKNPDVTIPVASPAGICLLKLVAWLDRPAEKRAKDALDIKYLIETYSKIPEIFDSIYEEGCMEAQGWDETRASALKLGGDVGSMARKTTKGFLEEHLFSQPEKIEIFAREMSPGGKYRNEENLALINILLASIRE